MSRLPKPSTRVPQPSRLQQPGMGLKRQACEDGNILSSPEKRNRSNRNSSSSVDGVKGTMPPPRMSVRSASKGTQRTGGIRKSVSMANLQAPLKERNTNSPSIGLSRNKFGSSSLNLTSRVTAPASGGKLRATIGSAGPGASTRRAVTNITNRFDPSTPKVTSRTISRPIASKPPANTDPALKPVKGKSKRAPWDLKGRVHDMEELLQKKELEKGNMVTKVEEFERRVAALEHEKKNLDQNLQQTVCASQATQEELDKLERELRNEQDGRAAEKRRLEQTVQDLEFNKSSLERQIKVLESELLARQDELAGLKLTVSQLTSAHAGIEAQLSSTKILLEDRTSRVATLEDEVAKQKDLIEEMNHKLEAGERMRRHLHNTVQELKGNIRVYCRVRPLLEEEIKANGDSDYIHHISFLDEKTLELVKDTGAGDTSSMSGLKNRGNGAIEFSFDQVFNTTASQASIFEEISQLVQSALDGYNVCVFAYGQTGSGKTFTMEGVHENPELEGMIPRTVKQIFASLKILEEKGWSYKVEASFLEIYNETIRDLLASPRDSKNLTHEIKLVDNKKNATFVTNLKVIEVTCESQVHHLLNIAQQQRAVAATNMNERSSRSHSVFTLRLTGSNSKTMENCEGNLHLVDLAGSERLKESGSEGARLTETQNINRSLANLGNVIMALAQKQSFIPYRNSKLTHLLQNSLGGNSKTLMFVNVSPLDHCYNETLNSLRFATKVNQCQIGTATKQIRK